MKNDEILAKLGFAGADEATQEEVIENVRTIVELRVIAAITELMTDAQHQEFKRLKETEEDAAVWAWLRESVVGVDVSEVYEATLQDYIDERQANAFKL